MICYGITVLWIFINNIMDWHFISIIVIPLLPYYDMLC